MIAPADVIKITNEFVKKVISYRNRQKYVVGLCPCELYPYFADAILATQLADAECLTHEDECRLNKKASNYTTDDPVIVVDSCDGQLTIALTRQDKTCTGEFVTRSYVTNPATTTSSKPTLVIGVDSPFVTGNLWLCGTYSGSCATPMACETVIGGVSSATFPGTANANKATLKFGFNALNSYAGGPNSYIKTLRVYKNDAISTISNTVIGPFDLDLDPATSPYYAASVNCPSCTSVSAGDVIIGSATFATSFATLMDNVSRAFYGAIDKHYMEAKSESNKYYLRCMAKSCPNGDWFGIHTSDAYIVVRDPDTNTNYIQSAVNGWGELNPLNYGQPLRFYHEGDEFAPSNTDYSCATFEPIIGDQWTSPHWNLTQTTFNKIVLFNNLGLNPITITSDTSVSCGLDQLIATYDTTNVDSVQWVDPNSDVISTTSTAEVTDTGTYTFEATLNNGCIISQTILVD